jgi:hypothetical protein
VTNKVHPLLIRTNIFTFTSFGTHLHKVGNHKSSIAEIKDGNAIRRHSPATLLITATFWKKEAKTVLSDADIRAIFFVVL